VLCPERHSLPLSPLLTLIEITSDPDCPKVNSRYSKHQDRGLETTWCTGIQPHFLCCTVVAKRSGLSSRSPMDYKKPRRRRSPAWTHAVAGSTRGVQFTNSFVISQPSFRTLPRSPQSPHPQHRKLYRRGSTKSIFQTST
jgi:hypothetical protein